MFYSKKWVVNAIILFTICLQITALPDTKKLKPNQSKRRQASFQSATNRKSAVSTHNGAAVPLPILKIQQNTGALPIVQVQQSIQPTSQPLQPMPFSHPVSQPTPFQNHQAPQHPSSAIQPLPLAPFSNFPQHQPAQINHAVPLIKNQPVIDHNYNYEYAVHDTHTGDFKEHRESRQNGNVEGYYSLIEPNGRKRVVRYNSSKLNGFQAHVSYENVGNIPIQPQVTNNHLEPNQQNNQQFLQQISNQFPQTHVAINTPAFSYKY